MTVTVTLSECHYDAAMPVVRCMNFVLLPLTKEEVNVFARVCLSVCLSVSKITQKCEHGFG